MLETELYQILNDQIACRRKIEQLKENQKEWKERHLYLFLCYQNYQDMISLMVNYSRLYQRKIYELTASDSISKEEMESQLDDELKKVEAKEKELDYKKNVLAHTSLFQQYQNYQNEKGRLLKHLSLCNRSEERQIIYQFIHNIQSKITMFEKKNQDFLYYYRQLERQIALIKQIEQEIMVGKQRLFCLSEADGSKQKWYADWLYRQRTRCYLEKVQQLNKQLTVFEQKPKLKEYHTLMLALTRYELQNQIFHNQEKELRSMPHECRWVVVKEDKSELHLKCLICQKEIVSKKDEVPVDYYRDGNETIFYSKKKERKILKELAKPELERSLKKVKRNI